MSIIATFHPQVWMDDYAIEVDPLGEASFDVTDEVVAMGKESALLIEDDQYSSDVFRTLDSVPEWIKDWNGPFYVEVQRSIATYFESNA